MKIRSLLVSLLLGISLAACSSATPATSTTTTLSKTQAKQEITNAFSTLFNLQNPSIAPKIAVTQDGSSLAAAMTSTFHSQLAKAAGGAKVDSVVFDSVSECQMADQPSPCAKVYYSIISPAGTPIFPTPSIGYAVEINGKWLVAKSTICSLLSLASASGTPQGC
ncbi:MAG: hypothetical protein HKL80_00395 [Acidimicrobiales bacterium]|nr:hypothetical protein [Acidimicrobiales bacterium]